MKQIYFFIFLFTSLYSNSQSDPYFIETKDTVSKRGPISITRNVLQDKKGSMWFSTWQGIMKYDGKVFTNYTLKENLIKFHVFSLLEDSKGNIWFGTIRGGLYRYDGKHFTLFTTKDGLISDLIECLREDAAGNIWIGTDAGVSCYDGKKFINYTTQNGLLDANVHSIALDKTGKLWFASGRGVNCYTQKDGFSNFAAVNNVRSIIESKDGTIWYGGQEGLFSYDNRSDASPKKLSSNFIGYIFEDKTGILWLSASEADVGKTFNRGDGMILFKYDKKNLEKIKNYSQVFGITQDKDGNIWFGTDGGIGRYGLLPGPAGKSIIEFKD